MVKGGAQLRLREASMKGLGTWGGGGGDSSQAQHSPDIYSVFKHLVTVYV